MCCELGYLSRLGLWHRPPGAGARGRSALWGRCDHDPLGPACCPAQALALGKAGMSSSSGIAAMLSAENMRRPSSYQYSSCSSSTAPTSRVIAASLGKMPTTRVRRCSHGFRPTQWAETCSVATLLGVVSVSQGSGSGRSPPPGLNQNRSGRCRQARLQVRPAGPIDPMRCATGTAPIRDQLQGSSQRPSSRIRAISASTPSASGTRRISSRPR